MSKLLSTLAFASVGWTQEEILETPTEKSCLALAMSGGASRGAYEAGVLWGMYFTDTDKSKYEYDVFTGVSIGAINAGYMGLFEKGDEENMIREISHQWEIL